MVSFGTVHSEYHPFGTESNGDDKYRYDVYVEADPIDDGPLARRPRWLRS